MRLWQRALHRAGVVLAYSEGFSPHPRMSLAAPLPIGVTSEAELMDIFDTRWVSPHFFTKAVSQQLEYSVEVETEKERRDIEAALASLLSLKHLPWQHQRDTGTRHYDLRALIDDLWFISWCHPYYTIGMRLCCDSNGSGRPEQVANALGFTQYPQSIHRIKLVLRAS